MSDKEKGLICILGEIQLVKIFSVIKMSIFMNVTNHFVYINSFSKEKNNICG